MKRTALKRGPAPKRKTRMKPKRSKPRRTTVHRDRKYLDWLKTKPCWIDSEVWKEYPHPLYALVDPAHGPSTGKSLKGPDCEAIPLCRHHHMEQHRIGWPRFERRHAINRSEIAAQMYVRYCMEMGKAE